MSKEINIELGEGVFLVADGNQVKVNISKGSWSNKQVSIEQLQDLKDFVNSIAIPCREHKWVTTVDHDNGNFYNHPVKDVCEVCHIDKPVDVITNIKIDKQTFINCDHDYEFDPKYYGHCPQPKHCKKCGVLDLNGYKGEIL